jgi:hypothetical protein
MSSHLGDRKWKFAVVLSTATILLASEMRVEATVLETLLVVL